jgi:hypothetical protein
VESYCFRSSREGAAGSALLRALASDCRFSSGAGA